MGDDPHDFESLLERMAPGADPGRDAGADADATPRIGATPPASTVVKTRPGTVEMPAAGPPSSAVSVRVPVSTAGATALPPEEARERLSWITLQAAGTCLVIYALWAITYPPGYLAEARPELDLPRVFPVEHLAAWGSVALSLVVFFLARGRKLPAAWVTDLGLLYYVSISIGISFFEHWEPFPTKFTPVHLSWVCLWIMIYPMIVPASRGKLIIAALGSALTGPMVIVLAVALRGVPLPDWPVLAWLVVPPFIAAALAAYPAPHIHRLESAARKARELGSYHLTERISRGGMGEVWRAEHRLLARPAAIKLIRPDLLGHTSARDRATTLRRFEREARITSTLRSPHTVDLYDFGLTEDGSFYAVMEYLDGMDLDQLVREHGPVPPARAIHFLIQACDSLAEAHDRGLLHRDIKPANLLACRYGLTDDFVKLLDFGLVLSADGGDEDAERLTSLGVVAGTPACVAPEVVGGEPDLGPGVDLYGLGCVGYWLLTGKKVFEAANARAMMMHHVATEADPPSTRTKQPIPEGLDRVVLDCLAKDPRARPADALALKQRLQAVSLDEEWSVSEAAEWWEKRPAGGDG